MKDLLQCVDKKWAKDLKQNEKTMKSI